MAAFKKRSFRPLNQKRVKEGASRTGSRFDSIFKTDVATLKLKVGVNNLRIVRGPDEEYWSEDIQVHAWVGAKKSTYLCPRGMGKSKRCPICDAASEAAESGDKEEASKLAVKQRSIAYVINRDDEKLGLLVWDMSWSQAQEIDATSDTKRGILDISHPDEGFDIMVRREGTGLNTRYVGFQIDRDASPLSDDARQQDAWLEEAGKKPLTTLLKFYPEDYLADILSGKVEEKDEDEDDEDAREARSTRGGRSRDEEAEEDDERPRSRSSRRAGTNGEDDDPPWDGEKARTSRRREVDDEEEEKPRRSRRDRDEEEEEPAPARRGRSAQSEDESEAEEAEAKRWRRGQRDDEEEEEKPASRKRRSDDEEAPPRRRAKPDDEPDDADEPPRRSTRSRRDEDEEEELRTRAGRTRSRDADSDEEEEERPRARTRERIRPEDDEPEERTVRRRTR